MKNTYVFIYNNFSNILRASSHDLPREWMTDERRRYAKEHPWLSLMQVTLRNDAGVAEKLAAAYSAFLSPLCFFSMLPIGVFTGSWQIVGWFFCAGAPRLLGSLLKRGVFRELRPESSLSPKPYGMPSNHSVIAMTQLVLVTHHISAACGGSICWYTVAMVLLVPIAPCRVVCRDHTVRQVFVGCLIGLTAGGLGLCIGL